MNTCKPTTGRMLAVFAATGAGLMFSATPAFAVLNGPTLQPSQCMQSVFDGGATVSGANLLNCTANDIRLSFATNPSVSTCTEGTHFSLTATFHTVVTANSRYDAAFFFRTDGGASARGNLNPATNIGICSLSQLTPGVSPALNLDGDTCGDLNAGTYDVVFTIPDVLCEAAPGTNPPLLRLPNCTSWHSNQGTACSIATTLNESGAKPDTKSKCVCDDTFTVPVVVEQGKVVATKDVTTDSPSSLPEPGGQFDYTISLTNSSTVQTVTIDSICDDQYGTIAYNAGPICTAGLIGSIDSTTCTLPQTLQPGGSQNPPAANSVYTCEFKATLTGNAQTSTDTVTFSGHDGANPPNPVSATDSAQVAITDVPASATVAKSLVGLACADVNYHVKVTNTDTGDAQITLQSLIDDHFGDLTTTGSNGMLSTTCGVATNAIPPGPGTLPATIAKGGKYECDFTAHFCDGSHTNTVTAKVRDESNTNVSQSSDPLTVNVTATVGP